MKRLIGVSCTAGAMLGLAFATQVAVAQQPPDQTLEKIEVTGSSIRRIESEGALPVTVITRDAIDKSGATSATELIQSLPAMTGGNFQQSSSSVNGNGYGETTAAIHGLDQKYTLVLLNGRRVAPFGGFGNSIGDGAVNLESIPLDAIERVEVLTDGASALYGSDAIAGVVNFITKKNTQEGAAFFNMAMPREPGGMKWSAGLSKGFGDFAADGYNVLVTYSHDYQQQLKALDRGISATGGVIPFSSGGTDYQLFQTSSNSLPANFTSSAGNSVNFYSVANGDCGTFSSPVIFKSGAKCRTNYAATVQDIPGSTRDSLFSSGRIKLRDDMTLFGEAVYSNYDMKAQFAPPAQPIGLSSTDPVGTPGFLLWPKYIAPWLAANGDTSTSGTMFYRAFDAGGRTDEFITKALHLVLGLDGTFRGWDYSASAIVSSNDSKDNLAGGYVDLNKFVGLIASGSYDPFIPLPGQSLQSAVLGGTFDETTVNQNSINVRASKDIFTMAGGPASLGLGADYTTQRIKESPSFMAEYGNRTVPQIGATDVAVGGFYGLMPLDVNRSNWGAFGELLMPVLPKVEVTASVRYDSYGKVKNDQPFALTPDVNGIYAALPAQEQGNTFDATTFKLSFRARPIEPLLLRGSFGSGFKAPTMQQIGSPTYFNTNTSGNYVCPYPGTVACNVQGDGTQFDLVATGTPQGGSSGLKAETSRQWTLGGRYEPAKAISLGLDLWNINMDNQILAGVPEGLAFHNPALFPNSFIVNYPDALGGPTIGLIQKPFNLGKAEYRGVDWDINSRVNTMLGSLAVDLSGTHMIKQRYQFKEFGGWRTDLGVFGPDNQVVFRNLMKLVVSLQSGDFTNTLIVNYKSGYRDQSFSSMDGIIYLRNPDGSRGAATDFAGLDVKSLTIFDWQTRYELNKNLRFTLGVNNVFGTPPPRSLKVVGGNQIGYDGRYADPTGRALTAGALLRF